MDGTQPRLPQNYTAWQNASYQGMYGKPRVSSANQINVSWNGVPGKFDLTLYQETIAADFLQALNAASCERLAAKAVELPILSSDVNRCFSVLF